MTVSKPFSKATAHISKNGTLTDSLSASIGMNCGRKTYEHGECTDTYYPEAKEAELFANNLWGYETDTEMTEEQTL